MRRALALIAVIVTAILLQSTVFSQLRLLGVRPELLYLVTILIALQEGPNQGAIVGFTCGLAQDMLLDQPMGITALTLTLLGYAVGVTSQYIVTQSALVPVVMVAVGTFVGVLFNRVVALLLGQAEASAYFVVRIALLSALYNAILTPIFFPLIRRLTQASTKQRVVRW